MENFNLVLNIGYKRKGDDVGSRERRDWWPKHVTAIGIGSSGSGECGVNSEAGEGKGRVIKKLLDHMSDFTLDDIMAKIDNLLRIMNSFNQNLKSSVPYVIPTFSGHRKVW